MPNKACHAELVSASPAQRRSRIKFGMTGGSHTKRSYVMLNLFQHLLYKGRSRIKFGMTVVTGSGGQGKNYELLYRAGNYVL